MKRTIKVPQNLFRSGTVETRDNGEIRLSISSDVPYKRYDWYEGEEYWEVLDHSPSGVDLTRLKAGAALLFNHDRDVQLGTLRAPTLEGGRCYVLAKLSEAEDVKSYKTRVDEGILKDTSVGYEIEDEGECIGAKDGLPIYKFKWAVHEASLVTIPADITVGVGRDAEKAAGDTMREISVEVQNDIDENENTTQTERTAPESSHPNPMKLSKLARQHFEADKDKGGNAPEIDTAKERAAAVQEFKARCQKIDGFVAALKNEAWRASAAKIAEKHKNGDANYEDFRTEANDSFSAAGATESDEGKERSGIIVVGERHNPNGNRALSVGAQFIRSKDFQERAKQTGRRRSITIDTDMSVMGIRGKVVLAQRAGFNSSDLSAINVAPSQQMISLGMERLTIMDLIAPGTTGAAAIPYPKETSQGTLDGVAVTAGMPRAGMVGERGVKPTWEPDVTTDTANVKKIAVVTKVPDEFLADFPGFQSYIDARLPAMVDFKAEEQILYGDGADTNIKGILTNAGVLTRAYATNWFTTIRKAITDVEVASFFTVDAIAMHPYDWEVASLELDANNQPYAGGPFYIPYGNGVFMEMRTFWGKPVVVTVAVAVGRPVIGCWKLGAQYFMREGMRLESTNANEDDFKRNLIAIRAEERLALATYRPTCFLEVTGGPARS